MRKILILIIFATTIFISCNNSKKTENAENAKSDSTQTEAIYQCPMDCENGKTYDKPGKCPVCDMELEKK